MRILKLTVLVAAVVLFGCSGVAAAAPKNYCADLRAWIRARRARFRCQTPPTTSISASRPTTPTRSLWPTTSLRRATDSSTWRKSPAPRDMPYELDITATNYGSAIPPRGTQDVVLKTYQQVGGAHPQTLYKAFNWDQTYRKSIAYATTADDNKTQPLWQPTADTLKVVFPIVGSELQKQTDSRCR